MTKRFEGENGVLGGLCAAEVEWKQEKNGAFLVPVERLGTEFLVDVDLVILSMGFVGPGNQKLLEDLALQRDERGNVKADARKMTSVSGLFVAGDMTQGQSLVVRAIEDGRKAAFGIMDYLKNKRKVDS